MKLSGESRFHCLNHGLIVSTAAAGILCPQSLNTAPDDLRVRVSVTLVQVDAVVTDAHGTFAFCLLTFAFASVPTRPQRSIRRLVRQTLLASEEPHKRPARCVTWSRSVPSSIGYRASKNLVLRATSRYAFGSRSYAVIVANW